MCDKDFHREIRRQRVYGKMWLRSNAPTMVGLFQIMVVFSKFLQWFFSLLCTKVKVDLEIVKGDLFKVKNKFQNYLFLQKYPRWSRSWLKWTSCCKFADNFYYRWWNKISSKTDLRYWIYIYSDIRHLKFDELWGEKMIPQTHRTRSSSLFHTSVASISHISHTGKRNQIP